MSDVCFTEILFILATWHIELIKRYLREQALNLNRSRCPKEIIVALISLIRDLQS